MPSLLSSTPLTLSDGQSVHAVDVHALVLLSILDQHLRRSEVAAPGTAGAPAKGAGADRAIGVLLGHVTAGVVEVTNAFGVLHVQHEGEVRFARGAPTPRRRLRSARAHADAAGRSPSALPSRLSRSLSLSSPSLFLSLFLSLSPAGFDPSRGRERAAGFAQEGQ